MKKLVQVFLICGIIVIAVPCLTSAFDLSRCIILDVPQEKIESQFGKMPPSQLTRQDSTAIASYRFTGDTLKVLAIMVEWDNRPGTYSKETFDSLLISRDIFPGGSVADYYYEVSYGQLNIVGEVIDWYNAGWYTGSFWFEYLFETLDPVIDYSQFDGDNNGDVDAAVFIRSGNGEEDSQNSWDIWSYAMIYLPGEGPGPFDGMHIPRWNTSPETQPLHDPNYPPGFLGVDILNKIAGEIEIIQKAAEKMAEVIAADDVVHVIGPGGHSNMAVEEVLWRAGGFAAMNGILDPGTNLIHGGARSMIIERTPGYGIKVLVAYRVGQ